MKQTLMRQKTTQQNQKTDDLTENRSDRRPGNPQMEGKDKNRIQHNIQQTASRNADHRQCRFTF